MIVFSHIRNTPNRGDMVSCPADYFDFPKHRLMNYDEPTPECKAVIYGGGCMNNWLRGRQDLPMQATKRITWGTGSSRHAEIVPWPDPIGFDLVGIREYTQEREAGGCYVPCVSCMSPLFDEDYAVTHDAVLFTNADQSIKQRYPVAVSGLPAMNNTQSFEDIVAFLGSAQTVVTNSYHGVYWATLLGRRVVCLPYSSKFHWFKYPPAYSQNGGLDWRERDREASANPFALEDARAKNVAFYERVLEVVG